MPPFCCVQTARITSGRGSCLPACGGFFPGPASAKVELTLAVGEQLEHRAKNSEIYLKYFKAWLTMKLELQ